MNGDSLSPIPNNSKVIHFVIGTVCLCALLAVGTQAWCYINKVPDMNTPLSSAFIHVTDTLVGALIAMLINTRPAGPRADDKPIIAPIPIVPTPVKIEQPAGDPIPVENVGNAGESLAPTEPQPHKTP